MVTYFRGAKCPEQSLQLHFQELYPSYSSYLTMQSSFGAHAKSQLVAGVMLQETGTDMGMGQH